MASAFGGSKKVNLLTDDQKYLLSDISQIARRELDTSKPAYAGQIAPGPTASHEAAYAMGPNLMGATPDINPTIQAMLSGQSAMPGDPSEYYYDAVYRPAKQAYDDEIKGLEARYGDAFGRSGGFANVLGESTARFGTGMGQTLGGLALRERDMANQSRAQGVNAGLIAPSSMATTLQTMLGVGDSQRGIQAGGNAEDFMKWQMEQPYNNPWLSLIGPTLGTQAYGVGQQAGIVPGIADALGGIMGGIGGMLGGM